MSLRLTKEDENVIPASCKRESSNDINANDVRGNDIVAGNIIGIDITARRISYYAICVAYISIACEDITSRRNPSLPVTVIDKIKRREK